jgi:predicted N-acyltransferase
MEQHGCLGQHSGWIPRYIVIHHTDELIAAMLLYEKTNSWGEFVFDHAWADAYARYGLSYYPKLVSAIPFSPVFGQKLLVKVGQEAEMYPHLLNGALSAARELACSSLHVLFPLPAEQSFLEDKGLIARHDCQYHWVNQNYASFDDFLARLSSRKRKNIRRERCRVQAANITFRVLDGSSAQSIDWQHFTEFYNLTYERKWGAPIFNQAFFAATAEALGEKMVLILADREQRCIAGALMYRGENILYGRHWGCSEYHDALHFETCYYQGIDYCIEHKIKTFEPGAQGPHKIARGFEPVLTHSAHWLEDERFRPAIKQFTRDEKDMILLQIKDAERHSAYKDK